METITYEYEDALYVNLTNRCDCNCDFCLRHNGHKGSIYADDLWLDHEPTREEVLSSFALRDLTSYREIVFCGFGEPMFRADDLLFLAGELKRLYENCPPIRVNTNGHGSLICGRDITPELRGKIDTVSVSLNGANAQDYCAVTHPRDGARAFEEMLDFTRRAALCVPHVVMTIVDKNDKSQDYVGQCRALAESLGATLRVRAYIPD